MKTYKKERLPWFKEDPKQPRKEFPLITLQQLNASLIVRQLKPLLAKPDGTIIDGARRYRAALLGGISELDVIVTDELLDDSAMQEIQLVSAMHTADLTPWEKSQGCLELLRLHPGWQHKELAKCLNIDSGYVTKLLAAEKCDAEAREAFKAGKLGVNDMYELSRKEVEEQRQWLAGKLGGKVRKRAEAAERTAKVKVALPGGVTVTLAGKSMSWDEIILTLTECTKEARKAQNSAVSVKSWSAVMADRAKGA
jgi:ParB/RepB/Spo0J family partition protein